jgi:hypothetical protein
MSISPQLGGEHHVEIPAGAISHRACGISSPIAFVHGVGAARPVQSAGRRRTGVPDRHHALSWARPRLGSVGIEEPQFQGLEYGLEWSAVGNPVLK